ncbi:MAG TPA: 1-deoxy-D-xylulose-5-phosphate synthase, partial [Flavobacteriia bacterium]|nr:1-deoxy-D-xylulose-5-phosphate synthase [Flavobacteriia bacterium]
RLVPNLIIASPINAIAFRNLLFTAQKGLDLPIAIRYPRGTIEKNLTGNLWQKEFETVEIGKIKQLSFGNEIAILSIGPIGNSIIEICKDMNYSSKIAHFDMQFLKPLDENLMHQIAKNFTEILTIEDGTIVGGLGTTIIDFLQENNFHNVQVKKLGIPDQFIEHGTTKELYKQVGLDINSIKKTIDKILIDS